MTKRISFFRGPKTEGSAGCVVSDPGRKPPSVYDLTEVDSEDDSDHDSGPESFVFDPVKCDVELDSVTDALERDLEDDGASVVQPAAEDVQEACNRSTSRTFRLELWSAPYPEALNFLIDHVPPASHACTSATPEGRVAIFADCGVKGVSCVGIRVGNR